MLLLWLQMPPWRPWKMRALCTFRGKRIPPFCLSVLGLLTGDTFCPYSLLTKTTWIIWTRRWSTCRSTRTCASWPVAPTSQGPFLFSQPHVPTRSVIATPSLLCCSSPSSEESLQRWRTLAVRSRRAARVILRGRRESAPSVSPVPSRWTDRYVGAGRYGQKFQILAVLRYMAFCSGR